MKSVAKSDVKSVSVQNRARTSKPQFMLLNEEENTALDQSLSTNSLDFHKIKFGIKTRKEEEDVRFSKL